MYPPLRATDLVPLRLVQQELQKDAGYLDRKDCPYSADIRDFLRSFGTGGTVAAANSVFLGESADSYEIIEAQIDGIYAELQALRSNDAGEQIQISKAKAGLLEKLLSLRERTLGVKNISGFKKAVLKAVDVLPAAERTAFIDALEALEGE